ncbi:MAG: class I SAM-dependent methyltransferase [Chloroflexota bacterium]
MSQLELNAIQQHFSRIADKYSQLRTTDEGPIAFIAKELREQPYVETADVGCGCGRYSSLLYRYMGSKLHLSCVDVTHSMLKALYRLFRAHNIDNFAAINAAAENLPFCSGTLDCVLSFNAVHHFDLLEFLQESARVLRDRGYLFIYTRLREQNCTNIWGWHFPQFCFKETRLHSLNTFIQTVESVPHLQLQSIEHFEYERFSTLEQLVERARAHHYSTFSLYSAQELEKFIAGFRRNIARSYKDVNQLKWLDEYTLFVIRRDT